MNDRQNDDQRTVIVTVATLKAFEAAVRERESARIRKERCAIALDAAKLAHERAGLDESDAIDAELAATKALHADQG